MSLHWTNPSGGGGELVLQSWLILSQTPGCPRKANDMCINHEGLQHKHFFLHKGENAQNTTDGMFRTSFNLCFAEIIQSYNEEVIDKNENWKQLKQLASFA